MFLFLECGGKMHLREQEFEEAHTDFFEAFKNYDESGSPRRTTCLKYLVLANMLMKSAINPFDSQEAKPYKNDPEILAITNLVRLVSQLVSQIINTSKNKHFAYIYLIIKYQGTKKFINVKKSDKEDKKQKVNILIIKSKKMSKDY